MIEHDTSAEGKIVCKKKKEKFTLGSADKHPMCPCSVAQKLLSIFLYVAAMCIYVHVTLECDIMPSFCFD